MSKKQPTIGLSSTEVEYLAMFEGAKESTWLQRLVNDFGVFDDEPILIFCDNQSSIKLAYRFVFHARIKHIEIYYHFIIEKMLSKEIDLNMIPTKNQIVNILIKSLSSSKIESLRTKLGVTSLQYFLRGKLEI